MKHLPLKATLLATSVLFLTACGGAEVTPTANTPATQAPATTSHTSGDDIHGLTVTHLSGVSDVPINPQSVMVFDMGLLDTLYYFGLAERIIGLPLDFVPLHLAHHFNAANGYVNIGTMHEPNFEEIILHDVDLIIHSGRTRPHFDELSLIAPTIDLGLVNGDMLESFVRNNSYLGQIFNIDEAMQNNLSDIRTAIDTIATEASELELEALIVMYSEGGLRAFGPRGRFGLIHDYFGFATVDETIDTANHGVVVTNEYLLAVDPDILFVIVRDYSISGEIPYADIENEIVQLTQAYINGNINYLNPEIWYIGNGGVRGMWEQLGEMRTAIERARG